MHHGRRFLSIIGRMEPLLAEENEWFAQDHEAAAPTRIYRFDRLERDLL
jgi:hypothetical protein